MNTVTTPAKTTERSAPFSVGQGSMSATSDNKRAGGSNLVKPYSNRTQPGGEAFNKGRLNGGTAVHHNGGTARIPAGSTKAPR